MASLQGPTNGRYRIQFTAPDGAAKTLRLGRVGRKAETILGYVEELLASKISGEPISRAAAAWVADLSGTLRDRVERVGLIEPTRTATLGFITDQYIARHPAAASTKLTWRTTARRLIEYFGADRELRTITAGDASDWQSWMVDGREPALAKATAGKSSSTAKQMLRYAVDKGYIDADPFARLKATRKPDTSKQHFVELEDASRILDVMPDTQWRLLFMLARLQGLRVPSEVLALTWDDIDWEAHRMTIRSEKTKRYEGDGVRHMPIFDDVMPLLMEAYDLAEPGERFVITRYRDNASNLRTQLVRYIEKAGLVPWPKPWQNLRATCATELEEEYPGKDVNAWLGHSEKVAREHYRMTRDKHFQDAVQLNRLATVAGPEKATRKATRKATKHMHAGDCDELREAERVRRQAVADATLSDDMQKKAASRETSQNAGDGRYRTRTCDLTRVKRAL